HHHRPTRHPPTAGHRLRLVLVDADAELRGERVGDHPTDIVTGLRVLVSRIAECHDQFHSGEDSGLVKNMHYRPSGCPHPNGLSSSTTTATMLRSPAAFCSGKDMPSTRPLPAKK